MEKTKELEDMIHIFYRQYAYNKRYNYTDEEMLWAMYQIGYADAKKRGKKNAS